MPLYTLQNKSTLKTVQITDPGGRSTVPSSGRAPRPRRATILVMWRASMYPPSDWVWATTLWCCFQPTLRSQSRNGTGTFSAYARNTGRSLNNPVAADRHDP